MLIEALANMIKVFDPKILGRGQNYFEKGYVLNVRFSDGLLKGRVKGSSGQIYDVHMDLKLWPKKVTHCTCSYQANCKHAVACLLALGEKEKKEHILSTKEKLDKRLDSWLKNLQAQAATLKKPEITHHVIYLIELKIDGFEHRVRIRLSLAKLLKRGGYGKMAPLNNINESIKQHFSNVDHELIAQLLFKCSVSGWFESLTTRSSELLEQIIATGRAFFSQNKNQPISLGESIQGECKWELSPSGAQNLRVLHDGTVLQPLLLDDSWYFNYSAVKMGHLTTSYSIKQLSALLDAPEIPLEQVQLLTKKMAKDFPTFPLPQVFIQREKRTEEPIPVLILNAVSELDDEFSFIIKSEEQQVLCFASIAFDYADLTIRGDESSNTVVCQQGDVLIQYIRDKHFEDSKWQEITELLHLRKPTVREKDTIKPLKKSDFILHDITTFDDLEQFYPSLLTKLKKHKWRVECLSNLYQEIVTLDEVEWYSELEESTNKFFSYQLGILIEGKSISIVPLIVDLIHHYGINELDNIPDTTCVKLPLHDGRALQLELGRIKPLVRLLVQMGLRSFTEDHALRLNKYQLMLMREAELAINATNARWLGAEQLREQVKQLSQLSHIPEIPTPKGLHAQLRDYQHYGLNWLQFLRMNDFSGILADDMGLGKTVQTLAHLSYEKEQNRHNKATLIIAPTSLVGNWRAEAKRFTPHLKVLVYHGSERQDNFADYDLVVSTYGLIQRDKEKFLTYHFYYLILDEAQFIKNARTKTTQIIQQLNACHRLCLSGTPLENHLGELWSLFHFLMPGLLGDAKQFKTWFRTPIEKHADASKRELLKKRIQPFLLRRTKNQVAKELPLKTEITHTIELIGPQRDLYEAIRMSMEEKVRHAIAKQGLGKSHILLLDALLKLRQVCCDPKLLSLPEAIIAHGTSAKLEALMDLLDNLVDEGRRILIFSQFTSMLQLIESKLQEKHYVYLKLTGQTSNRQILVEQFQQGNIPIFLISLKAGGTGLNLTRADTVIHYDPWWNPAVEDQATDRTHRIGQENPVFVYKLITSGTVEEAILGMQEKKRQLVTGVLSDNAAHNMSLSQEDIELFFTPLGG